MKVISFLNQKGGVGKTTLATNVAHALQLNGSKVLLVDADPQGSARDWNEMNKDNLFPVVGLDRENIASNLKQIATGFDIVIIDGAPHTMKLSSSAIKVSDLIVIPVQPSPYDIWATAELVDMIETRQSVSDLPVKAVFLISRRIQNTNLSKEINEGLSSYNLPVLNSSTSQRVLYASRASEGETVLSTSDNNPAAEEIKAIANELMEVLQK